MRITIPDDAPFTPEQRQWLAGLPRGVGISGAGKDLSLCLPGEAETAAMLENLMKEAGNL
jgi:hypothetical protein